MLKTVSTHRVVQKYEGDMASGIPPMYVLSEAVYVEPMGTSHMHWMRIGYGNLRDVMQQIVWRSTRVVTGELKLQGSAKARPDVYVKRWLEEFKRCRHISLEKLRRSEQSGQSPLKGGEISFVGPQRRVDLKVLPEVIDSWTPATDQANRIVPTLEPEKVITAKVTPIGAPSFFFWKEDGREEVLGAAQCQARLISDIGACLVEADQAGLVTSMMLDHWKWLSDVPEIDGDDYKLLFNREPTDLHESGMAKVVRQNQQMPLDAFAEKLCDEGKVDPTDFWSDILTSIDGNPLYRLVPKTTTRVATFSVSRNEGGRIQPVTLI